MVHPAKAFLLRHIPLPEVYSPENWPEDYRYYRFRGKPYDDIPDPEVVRYIDRLHASAETLFGPMEFQLHCNRSYTDGLPFHSDMEGHEDDDVVAMATAVHNATDEPRALTFARPTWKDNIEKFDLIVPAGLILIFGSELATEYEHGILPGTRTRSVVTRFMRCA